VLPLPPVVRDGTLPTAQSSHGTHKFICEQLVAEYMRKGCPDGRSARLMTVAVRPGKPDAAASGFVFRDRPRDALAEIAGPAVAARVRFEADATIARIVGGWPARFESQRAARLGLRPDADFRSIVRQYISFMDTVMSARRT
jgi:hypothetical protein